MSETEVLPEQETRVHEDVRPDTSHGDGDHERFAHYVQKDKIVDSSVMGTPLVALCGKVWVPSRDPKRYPVCPTCKEIYERLPRATAADDELEGRRALGQPGLTAAHPVTFRPRDHPSI